MNEAAICFPHQLFEKNPIINKDREIYLIEDSLFFGDAKFPFNFHKKKLIFHRASMKYYEEYLIKKNYDVYYLDYNPSYRNNPNENTIKILFKKLKRKGVQRVLALDPVDWALERRIQREALNHEIEIVIKENPAFINRKSTILNFFHNKKRYRQTSFYIAQRKNLNILIENDKPKGGKWTFDKENRKKIPRNYNIPKIPKLDVNKYLKEAIKYVEFNFPSNPGNIEDFFYPTTHKESYEWFQTFLEERFKYFGPYEDAIRAENSFLFHSILSPLLNCGLLEPVSVIKKTIEFSEKNNISLNSSEGFIRQIIGWREFIRAIYLLEGVYQRNSNFWNHKNPIPKSFYNGTTGILPVDNLIKRLLNNAYLHHIERLMILGNFMNLCEMNPNDIYQWFMELFIDAYDWVMVPNVYGMSLYADGGLITSKPYISSSNYILKMSNYPKGDWCEIWDGLFWRFIHKHQSELKKNPRMNMMVNLINKMNKNKLKNHLKVADSFLNKLYK